MLSTRIRLKKYSNFVYEKMTENELNKLLDKINRKEKLTPEEKYELDNFDNIDDNIDDDIKKSDTVEFDSEGDLIINGKRSNPYNIPDNLYDISRVPTSLDDNLKEFIKDYLNNNYELKSITGIFMKQIYDKNNGKMVNHNELISRVRWDLNIKEDIKISNFIESWIKK